MTVADLIEVLQQCPNPRVPVVIRALQIDENGDPYTKRIEVEDARFDGGAVVIDAD